MKTKSLKIVLTKLAQDDKITKLPKHTATQTTLEGAQMLDYLVYEPTKKFELNIDNWIVKQPWKFYKRISK